MRTYNICRFPSALSSGVQLTWPHASFLIDVSSAPSHRFVIFLGVRASAIGPGGWDAAGQKEVPSVVDVEAES
jgi:hypothetical protein